jgi:hypothetical protein
LRCILRHDAALGSWRMDGFPVEEDMNIGILWLTRIPRPTWEQLARAAEYYAAVRATATVRRHPSAGSDHPSVDVSPSASADVWRTLLDRSRRS